MAKIIETISNDAVLTLSKSFDRANGQPLDSTSLFNSLVLAEEYAKTNKAYVGQVISVIDDDKVRAYIIKDEAGTLESVGNTNYTNKNGEVVPLQEAVGEIETNYLDKRVGGEISSNIKLKNSAIELNHEPQGILSGNKSIISIQRFNPGLYFSSKSYTNNSDEYKAVKLRLKDPGTQESMIQANFKSALTLQLDGDVNIAGFPNEYRIYGEHNKDLLKSAISDTFATKEEIGNITNIVNFRGVIEDKDTLENPEQGDIVIEGSKEFIYDGSKWVELGDLTPTQEAIEDLQTQLDEAKAELKEYVDNNGTKTYSNFESLETDLNSGKLYKGQIVTVVDDYDAEAYIVFSIEEGKASVMPLSGSGSLDTAEVISENTITDIISNNFESTPITTKYSIKPGTINDIIDGTYEGGESNLDSEIDNIINPKEE